MVQKSSGPCDTQVNFYGKHGNVVQAKRSFESTVQIWKRKRHLFLAVCMVHVVLVSPHFFNWADWEHILLNEEVPNCRDRASHDELSHSDEQGGPSESSSANSKTVCEKNELSKVSLYHTFAMTGYFSFVLVAGLGSDILGPRVCCVTGSFLVTVSWVVMALGTGPTGKKVGFFLLGAGTEPAFLGTLSLVLLYPAKGSTILSLLGTARGIGYAIPFVFKVSNNSFPSFTFTQMCFTMVAISSVSVLLTVCMPSKAVFDHLYLENNANKLHGKEEGPVGNLPEDEDYSEIPDNEKSTEIFGNQKDSDLDIVSNGTGYIIGAERVRLPSRRKDVEELVDQDDNTHPEREFYAKKLISASSEEPILNNPETQKTIKRDRVLEQPTATRRIDDFTLLSLELLKQMLKIFQYLRNPLYISTVVILAINIMKHTFFTQAVVPQFKHPKKNFIVSLFNMLSVLPGILFVWLVRTQGPIFVIILINITSISAFLLLLLNGTMDDLLICILDNILFWPTTCFLLSQVYCLIASVFPFEDFGKLTGTACGISAMSLFLINLLVKVVMSQNTYIYANFGAVSVLCFMFLPVFFIKRRISQS